MDKPKAEAFLSARLANGKAMLNDPGMVKALVKLALIQDPASSVMPAGAGTSGLVDEMTQIEKSMGTKAYDAKAQERYRQLIDARLKAEPGWKP
jgi:hypothetical protein